MITEHADLCAIVEYNTGERIKKDLVRCGWMNAALVCLDAGQEIPPHPEPYGVLFYVIEGVGRMTVGGNVYDVKPGHVVLVPKGGVRGIAPRTKMSLLGVQEPH